MRVSRVIAAALMMAAFSTSALAAGWRHGPELQGGMGHWGEYDAPIVDAFDIQFRWRPTMGAGWFVERPVGGGFTLGSALAYRIVGDEVRAPFSSSGYSFDERYRMTVQQVVLPLRVEHAIPHVPALGVELGLQGEYILKAMNKHESRDPAPLVRSPRPLTSDATIFESIKDEYEITSGTRRLGAAASAGLTWRTKLFRHDAMLAASYERGITPLWKDGLDRFANRVGLALRWAL